MREISLNQYKETYNLKRKISILYVKRNFHNFFKYLQMRRYIYISHSPDKITNEKKKKKSVISFMLYLCIL